MPQRTDRRPSPDGEGFWSSPDFTPAEAAPARRELGLGSQFLIAGIKKPRSRFCRRKRSSKGLDELVQKLRAVLGIPPEASSPAGDAALSPPPEGLHLLESMLEQGPPSSDEMDAIQLLLNISCMTSTFPESRKASQVAGHLANHRPKLTEDRARQKPFSSAVLPADQPNGSRDVKSLRPPKRKARVLSIIGTGFPLTVHDRPSLPVLSLKWPLDNPEDHMNRAASSEAPCCGWALVNKP